MGKYKKRNLLKEEKGIRNYKGTTDIALLSNTKTQHKPGNQVISFKIALIAALSKKRTTPWLLTSSIPVNLPKQQLSVMWK